MVDELDMIELAQDMLLHALGEAIALVDGADDKSFNDSLEEYIMRSRNAVGSGNHKVDLLVGDMIIARLKR